MIELARLPDPSLLRKTEERLKKEQK